MNKKSSVVATPNVETVNAAAAASYESLSQKNMEKETLNEVEICLNGECRLAAFVRGVNRGVINKHVTALAELMLEKGYRKAELVQVMKAEELLAREPELELVDIYGVPVKEEDASFYCVVADGRQRVMAAQAANARLASEGEELITVPAVEVELAEGETLARYVYEINSTKEAWKSAEYAQAAANVEGNPILERFAEKLKSKSNPEGLTLKTLNGVYNIFTPISGASLKAMCEPTSRTGKSQRQLLAIYDPSQGDEFLHLCEAAGLTARDINQGIPAMFHGLCSGGYGREVALEVFRRLSPEKVESLRNSRGVLNKRAFELLLTEMAAAIKAEWASSPSQEADPVEEARAREALKGVIEQLASPLPEVV